MAKRDNESGGSFWTTTLGILTQIGAILGAIAAILGFVLAGNGDDEQAASGDRESSIAHTEEPTRTQEQSAPTRGDWVRAMNSHCGELKSEATALGPSPPEVDGAIEYSKRVSVLWQQLVQAAQEVPAPEGDQSQVDRMLSLWNEAGDQFGQLANAIASQDEASYNSHIAEGRRLAQSGSRIAIGLGAQRCSGVS